MAEKQIVDRYDHPLQEGLYVDGLTFELYNIKRPTNPLNGNHLVMFNSQGAYFPCHNRANYIQKNFSRVNNPTEFLKRMEKEISWARKQISLENRTSDDEPDSTERTKEQRPKRSGLFHLKE